MKMHKRWLPLLVSLGVALMPAVAQADMGTALMWFGPLHLLFGNLFIGIAEGLLIGLLFKQPKSLTVPLMIAANYASGLAGYGLVRTFAFRFEDAVLRDIGNAKWYLWGAWLLMIAGTVVVEFPFCFVIFRKMERRIRKALLAFLVSQSASYAVLIVLYFSASNTAILTATKFERSLSFAKCTNAIVYYLSYGDGAIWRIRLDGNSAEKVTERGNVHDTDRLRAGVATDRKSEVLLVWDRYENSKAILIAEGAKIVCAPKISVGPETPKYTLPDSYHYYEYRTDDLRPENHQGLDCMIGDFGALCFNYNKPDERWLGLEMPMMNWLIGSVTVLPGDQLICNFRDKIVLLDMHTLQMAVVARGHSPVVVLE